MHSHLRQLSTNATPTYAIYMYLKTGHRPLRQYAKLAYFGYDVCMSMLSVQLYDDEIYY